MYLYRMPTPSCTSIQRGPLYRNTYTGEQFRTDKDLEKCT